MILLNLMRALLLFAVLATPFALAGCETSEGFGRDVQSAGEAIEKEAQEAD